MSLNKISPAPGNKIYSRKINSETETIELDLIQSFPVGVQETIKQRRSNETGNINKEDGAKNHTSKPQQTPSMLNSKIVKIEVNSRKISAEQSETPSTGAVGRFWKWSDYDISQTPTINSKDRARNISVTSTTSRESSSSILTDINPYISLIHSGSLRRQPRESPELKIEETSDYQSISDKEKTLDNHVVSKDTIDPISDDPRTKAMPEENIIRVKHYEENGGFRKRNAKSMSIPPINLTLAAHELHSNADSGNTKGTNGVARIRRQTPSPLLSAATSPTFPSYLMSKEKPNSITRAQTDGAFVFQPPVCLVQSKTRAKAKSAIDKGGSKIFENYKSTVTKRTQHPEGNMQRRIRRTTSCGSLEIKGSKSNQLQVDDERKRRNSGEANFNHIKGHYIITKSHQDKVHSKNVAHQGPNLSAEQGQEIKREGIRRSMRRKIGKLLAGNAEKASGSSVEK